MMASISSNNTVLGGDISSKPWFLTFNQANKDVIVWKNDIRLKVQHGQSAGCLREVSVRGECFWYVLSYYQRVR